MYVEEEVRQDATGGGKKDIFGSVVLELEVRVNFIDWEMSLYLETSPWKAPAL